MASSPQASCLSDPNFAVICAFLERFAKSCGINYPTFVDLQEMLENAEQVSQELVDLHIKLLRKARKTVFLEKWEKALVKFCHSYSSQDGWEIERFGYKKSRLEVKLRALKMLLEGQFDLNSKFKATINTLESEELRSKPLGKDKLGRLYWLQFDSVSNIRVYREDHDEESWTLVAQDRSSLVNLLHELSGDEFPLDLNILNGNNVILEIDKQVTDTGQGVDLSAEKEIVNSDSNLSAVVENNVKTENENTVHTSEHSEVVHDKIKLEENNSLGNEMEKKDFLPVQLENNDIKPECEDVDMENSSAPNTEGNSLSGEGVTNHTSGDGVIEEPVMYITGNGDGEDCMTGNPDMDGQSDNESNKVNQEDISEDKCKVSVQSSSDLDTITDVEKQKTTPKLWTIDTICGVKNKSPTGGTSEVSNSENSETKSKQKNFSTFSIDSVLEKKDVSAFDHSATPKKAPVSADKPVDGSCCQNETEESVKIHHSPEPSNLKDENRIENCTAPLEAESLVNKSLTSTETKNIQVNDDSSEKSAFKCETSTSTERTSNENHSETPGDNVIKCEPTCHTSEPITTEESSPEKSAQISEPSKDEETEKSTQNSEPPKDEETEKPAVQESVCIAEGVEKDKKEPVVQPNDNQKFSCEPDVSSEPTTANEKESESEDKEIKTAGDDESITPTNPSPSPEAQKSCVEPTPEPEKSPQVENVTSENSENSVAISDIPSFPCSVKEENTEAIEKVDESENTTETVVYRDSDPSAIVSKEDIGVDKIESKVECSADDKSDKPLSPVSQVETAESEVKQEKKMTENDNEEFPAEKTVHVSEGKESTEEKTDQKISTTVTQEDQKTDNDVMNSEPAPSENAVEETSNSNNEELDNNGEDSNKSPTSKKRKKKVHPQRILSRNRRTTEEETKEELDSSETQGENVNDDKTTPAKGEKHDESPQKSEEENDAEKPSHPDSQEPEVQESVEEEKATTPSSVPRGKGHSRRRRRRKNRDKLKKRKPEGSDVKEEAVEGDGEEGQKEEVEEGGDEISSKRKGRPKKNESAGRPIPAREIKLLGISETETEVPSIRQSRRIAQMKMKEEAERRRIEALQLETFKHKKKSGKSSKKKSKKNADSDSYDDKDGNDDDESDDFKAKISKDRKGRRRKKKDKLVFDELNPWLSSSGSSTADEDDEMEEEPHEEEEEEELVFKSDHEFSPESDVEDPDYKPMKRARTAKVEESKDEAGKYDDTSCEKCGNNDHPEWILLCDKCDKGWHASCVRPALMLVPEGDWYCPPCEHSTLIEKLQQSLVQYDRTQKQRENEELRKKRLAFVGISLDNVLPPVKKNHCKNEEEVGETERSTEEASESGSESESASEDSDSGSEEEPVYRLRERRSNMTSYRYNEYDELIKSALQDEMEAVKGAGNAGKGKDISNIVNAERQRENEEASDADSTKGRFSHPTDKSAHKDDSASARHVALSPGDSEGKERVSENAGGRDNTNTEGESEGEEEDDNLADEIPAVVPKYAGKKKKSKSMKITSLDFTSEEEDNNSDSDFKGVSSEEESDYSLPSDSESSDDRRKRRGSDGPLRRSTRARVSRYDRDFINDDSDDSPKRKKNRREWDSSESSDSDTSWGRKKKRTGKISQRYTTKKSTSKSKRKKSRAYSPDSGREESATPKKQKNRKIKYGGLDSLDEDTVLTRRTRGKKINYQEITGSDSDVDGGNRKGRGSRVIESDDDFVAENEKEEEDEELRDGDSEERESIEEEEDMDSDGDVDSSQKRSNLGKKKLLEKIKKKKWVIPDPDDFSENDLMEDEQLDKVAEELDNLDEDEEEILEKILESGDVPIRELKAAVSRAKKEKKTDNLQVDKSNTYPATVLSSATKPAQGPETNREFSKMNPMGTTPGLATFTETPKQQAAMAVAGDPNRLIGIDKITAAKPMALDSERLTTGFLFKTLQGDVRYPVGPLVENARLPNPRLNDPKSMRIPGEPLSDYVPNPLSTVPGSSANTINSRGPTVDASSADATPFKFKRKLDEVSSHSESMDLVFPPRQGDEFSHLNNVQDSPPKKKGRGRGKKQEPQVQGRVPCVSDATPPIVGLHQAQVRFPVKPEGESVITRILNAPQGPQGAFPMGGDPTRFPAAVRPRPPFPPFPGSPRGLPALRLRHPGPGGPMFHAPHPLDPSPSGGGPINIPISNSGIPKSPALGGPLPAFSRPSPLAALPPRFPPDSAGRQPYSATRNSPPRPEFSFASYYGGFQPGGANLPDSAPYQNPAFQEQSFGEDVAIGCKQFDDETGGEFGGLASYFASQREDDLDT